MTPNLSCYWEGEREQCEDNKYGKGMKARMPHHCIILAYDIVATHAVPHSQYSRTAAATAVLLSACIYLPRVLLSLASKGTLV